MNYQETLDYLFSRLPMFQRVGNTAFKKDLSNTIRLATILDNPQDKFKSIHVAGTNGKGSVSHSLASILQEQGYKVGLYTSPHLVDFRERVRINGEVIIEKYVVDFVAKHQDDFNEIQPSFFEWTVALAFNYFASEKVDFAVIETGLGGRLDSTNIITPILSVITNISYDHQSILGDTLELIGAEKAGIIKTGIPVVIGQDSGIRAVFEQKALQEKAPIYFSESDNANLPEFELKGSYQKANLLTILKSCEVLSDYIKLDDKSIINGLKSVTTNTGLRGRWETLSTTPLTICDTGHNVEGIKAIVNQLKSIPHNKLHFIITVVNDKDISAILKLLPTRASYYVSEAKIPRALKKEALLDLMKENGLNGNIYNTIKDAIQSAQKTANQDDFIFIGGSTFTVAEALEIF
ncbi:bifunctional folylpolyglutamate synthase/dihydrofolate synthase [Vicingaceae bacterium]|nr:bifunctional folylpolyglutamate synthase/dihydrofolate synthase [Vicingaceae bacterium]